MARHRKAFGPAQLLGWCHRRKSQLMAELKRLLIRQKKEIQELGSRKQQF